MTIDRFSKVEKAKGIHYDPAEARQSSLSAWYDSIRKRPFSEFSIEDLCKCVRQNLGLEYIIGRVLEELRKDPLVGEMYEGELANALTFVQERFWVEHEDERAKVRAVLRDAYERYPDVKRNIDCMFKRWDQDEDERGKGRSSDLTGP